MRSRLAKSVRKEFESRLKRDLPQFCLVESEPLPPGCRLFRWAMTPGFTAFLFLLISPNDESFTIEVAWSHDGNFPRMFPRIPVDFPAEGVARDKPRDGRFRFRLKRLWDPRLDPFWYIVPRLVGSEMNERLMNIARGIDDEPPTEELLAKVGPLIEEAIGRVVTQAVPYLRNVAESPPSS
jgi:hypothetical protein